MSEELINVTELKQYVYCPRIIYFSYVLRAHPKFYSQQMEGKIIHENITRKEIRRIGSVIEFKNSQKIFGLNLESHKLNLKGNLDCLIIKDGEYIPVDYKFMKSNKKRAWLDHKVQITAYSMLIEDNFNKIVKRGYIYYELEDLPIKVPITPSLRRLTKLIIEDIKRIKYHEILPAKTPDISKCRGGCGYLWICKRA